MTKEKIILIFCVVAAIVLSPIQILGLQEYRVGEAGTVFALVGEPYSARIMALGHCRSTLADGANSLAGNPAGLEQVQTMQIGLHHQQWLKDIREETLSVGIPVGGLGGFALETTWVDFGVFSARDEEGTVTGEYSANRFNGEFGWGRKVAFGTSVGLAGKFMYETIDNAVLQGLGMDAGIAQELPKGFKIGLVVKNLGVSFSGGQLPVIVLGGMTWKTENDGDSFMVLFDTGYEPGRKWLVATGLEYEVKDMWSLRLGYHTGFEEEYLAGLTGISGGVGVRINGFSIDYGAEFFGDAGVRHRVSLGWDLRAGLKVNEQTAESATTVSTFSIDADGGEEEAAGSEGKSKLNLYFQLDEESKENETALVQQYKMMLEKEAENAKLWKQLGGIYQKQKKHGSAMQCYEQYLRLKPEDGSFRTWFAEYRSFVSDIKK